jgi:hypothetical protein
MSMLPGSEKIENGWYSYVHSDTTIVFVHGILSNNQDAWLYKRTDRETKDYFWPEIIRSDIRFRNPAIFLAGYYTSLDAGEYGLRNCADELFCALSIGDSFGRPPALESKRVILICHSLGGNVARYMIEANSATLQEKTVGLVLIASPSYGSGYANTLLPLLKLYRNRTGRQLLWHRHT